MKIEQVTSLKDTAIQIFHEAGFELHKWREKNWQMRLIKASQNINWV